MYQKLVFDECLDPGHLRLKGLLFDQSLAKTAAYLL